VGGKRGKGKTSGDARLGKSGATGLGGEKKGLAGGIEGWSVRGIMESGLLLCKPELNLLDDPRERIRKERRGKGRGGGLNYKKSSHEGTDWKKKEY